MNRLKNLHDWLCIHFITVIVRGIEDAGGWETALRLDLGLLLNPSLESAKSHLGLLVNRIIAVTGALQGFVEILLMGASAMKRPCFL